MKKLLSIILAAGMVLSTMITVSFAASLPFTDVKSSDWFYEDVKTAYESNLINGKTTTTYAPEENMTYGEAIKLAACMHQLAVDGKVTALKGSGKWYQPYMDYCKKENIISKSYNGDAKATRSGYMEIFANCLPEENLKEINSIADGSIPDVPASAAYAAGVYKLYRAGVVTGVDDQHNCNPSSNIKRSEVAAILTRMNDSSARKTFSLGEQAKAQTTTSAAAATSSAAAATSAAAADAAQALKVDFDSTAIAPETGELVTLSVSASGGVSPYTYDWQFHRSAVTDPDKFISVDTSSKTYTNGHDTFSFTMNDEFKNNYDAVRCVVTDKAGTSVTTEKKSISCSFGKFTQESLASDDFVMYVSSVQQGNTVLGTITNGKVSENDLLYLVSHEDGKNHPVTVKNIYTDSVLRSGESKSVASASASAKATLTIVKLVLDVPTGANIVEGDCLLGANNKGGAIGLMVTGTFTPESPDTVTAKVDAEKNYIYTPADPKARIGTTDYSAAKVLNKYAAYIYRDGYTSSGKMMAQFVPDNSSTFVYIGQTITIKDGETKLGTMTVTKLGV